jgi:glutaredoxin 3
VDYGKRSIRVEYVDVSRDAAAMARFLRVSGGDRRIPVIEEAGEITVGFGGT